jgi:peptide/nickel transport system substrate-binding protein
MTLPRPFRSHPRRAVRRRLSVALVGLGVLLAACTPPGEPSNDSGAPGKGSTLTAAWGYLGTHDWSPAGSASDNEKVLALISNALVGINPQTLELQGELAESYSLSDDGTTWTFKLRPNVKFHDDYGTLTAEDVKYNWAEYISEESEHGAAEQLAQAIDGKLENFEIVNDLEFRLHTTKPMVHLPAVLCSCASGMAILSKAYADKVDDATEARHPVGTGPWKFVSSTNGVNVILKANPDYWGSPKPSFENLVLQEIPDSAARLVQVQSGAVDIAELAPSLVGEAEAAKLQVLSVPDVGNVFVILGGSYWGDPKCCKLDEDAPWIQADNPQAGKAIREAMSLAIDRKLILDTILKGRGELSYGALLQYNNNPLLKDPSWTLPEHNLDQARQKLAEGGYPNGFPVKMFMYEGGETDLPSVAEAVAGMWEELGLKVERQTADEDVLDALLDKADTDGLAWVKLAGFSAEPALELGRYLERRGRDQKFLHPALEAGYEKIVAEPDREKRFAATRDMISALRNDSIVLPLFTADMVFVAGPRVGSWTPIPGLNAFSGFETITPSK